MASRQMQCSAYPCEETATWWMEWRTIGRPKGRPVCDRHKEEADKPDNYGEHPTFEAL